MCDIDINGHAGMSFIQEIPGGVSTTIIWNDGEYAYSLCGNLTVEQLIQIANTVK